ncbi:OB-fold nucleic acid binding domain-containing protein [Candidatus Hecatella orcuttiae]|jgi:replication factor A1|uniref:OB-fold nucleic acid binding domain-containing protein n=1 Tax=Candidatus Hecatella orcuttiae TaxID=1935119 RepID=UPI0028681755|nr:OB-fold nucleic acid binding domain-containing protein [Candidatus Hecatella orcuttiae]
MTEPQPSSRLEAILVKIMAEKPDLTREKLLEMVESKRAEAKSLLNPEGAAFLVALDLGVSLWDSSLAVDTEIEDVISGLRDVSLTGRVLGVYPVKLFKRPDGQEGKLKRLLLGDKTGVLEVYLWNQKAEEAERLKIQPDAVVKIEHGYTRTSLAGKTELHVADSGRIALIPPSQVGGEVQVPALGEFFQEIRSLKKPGEEVNLSGEIIQAYPARKFLRSDGGEGTVMRLRLRDDSGEINLVVWNDWVEAVEKARVGDRIEVIRGKTRENRLGELEAHVNRNTYLKLTPTPTPAAPVEDKPTPLGRINPGMRNLTVEGVMVDAPAVREVTLKDGTQTQVASFRLRDETGVLRVSAWRKQAEILAKFPPGVQIRLKNVTAKPGLQGETELSTGSFTVVELISQPSESESKPSTRLFSDEKARG